MSSTNKEEDWEYYDDSVYLTDFWTGLLSNPEKLDPLQPWLEYVASDSSKNEDLLSNPFFDYWRILAPRLLAFSRGKNCLDQEYDESRIAEELIRPLEAFLCGSSEHIEETFEEFSAIDIPPAICGKIFMSGEPCYFCRDCGQDATCVMCRICFEKSVHKKHRYRMSTSEGGGYCDCGDQEAFREGAFCSLHAINKEKQISHAEIYERIPTDVKTRAEELFRQIIRYIFKATNFRRGDRDFAVGAKEKETWTELNYVFKFSNYCVVLHNDEIHSYNDVIRALKKNMGSRCSNKMAADITTFIDKHGRGVLKVGNYSDCATLCSRIELTSRHDGVSLKCVVVPTYVIAHQMFATRLLRWLTEDLLPKYAVFRAIISHVIFLEEEQWKIALDSTKSSHSVCEAVLLNDTKVWKEIKGLWRDVMISGVMKDYESKKILAKLYSKNYQSIMESFVEDDQEYDTSITSLSVQIYTVPSLSEYLIREENVFYIMIKSFYDLMKNYCEEGSAGETTINLSSWQDDDKSVFNRAWRMTYDLNYVLSVVPDSISEPLRKNFLAGAEVLVECLSLLQGLDSQNRQVGEHIEFESMEWERVYKIISIFSDMIELVVKWAKRDKNILIGLVNILLSKCFRVEDGDSIIVKSCNFCDEVFEYVFMDYDVSNMSVSTNVPLHRFLGRVVACFNNFPTPGLISKVKQRLENRGSLVHLINPVLNAIVTIAQINAGMWKRNGSSAEAQAYLYSNPDFRPSPKRSDLTLLQTITSLASDPGVIVMSLMQRFRIIPWMNGDLDKSERNSAEFYERNNALVDEFLSFLLALVCERKIMGEENEEIKHHIIHLMCVEPMTHSSIISHLLKDENQDVDLLIKEVADLKKDGNKMVYHLKDEYFKEYNVFYYFYSKEQQSLALENKIRLNKKETFYPPPTLPQFPPLYEGLRYVLRSIPVMKMLQTNFEREAKSPYLTSKHVHKLLFLISAGINDDLREGTPSFVEKAEKMNLNSLLKKRSQDFEELKDLFHYVSNLLNKARKTLLNLDDEEVVGCSSSTSTSSAASSTSLSEGDRKRRGEIAAIRRAKIMAQMNQMQKKFAQEYADDLIDMEVITDGEDVEIRRGEEKFQIAVGLNRTPSYSCDKRYTCILCQEEQTLFCQSNGEGDALIVASYLQKSAVLSQDPNLCYVNRGKCNQDFLPSDLGVGPCVTSCGHSMHARCYQKFLDSLVSKERERHQGMIRNILNYDVMQSEYLCPICERLSNCVLPIMPPISTFVPLLKASSQDFAIWTREMKKILKNKYMEDEDDEMKAVLPRLKLKASSIQHSPNMETPVLPPPLNNMCNIFAMTTFTKSLKLHPSEGDYRVLQMIFQCCSLSLHLLDSKEKTNLSVTERELEMMGSLVRLCVAFPMTTSTTLSPRHPMHKFFRSNGVYLFSLLLDSTPDGKSYLDIDALNVLITSVVSYSSLIFTEKENRFHLGEQDMNILQLVFLFHLTQIASSIVYKEERDCIDDEEDRVAHRLLERVRGEGKKSCIGGIARQIKDKALRFLRCASLFFHLYTDIPLINHFRMSYTDLTRYLGLPSTLREVLTDDSDELIDNWTSSGRRYPLVDLPCQPRRLIPLPKDYITLLNRAATYRCPNNVAGECKSPVLCLICDAIICQQSHCCETVMDGRTVGGCTSHSRKCAADVGIYLNLRECQVIVLVDGERGAYLSAPYVDEYGENDDGLKRGNPLFLDTQSYEELSKMWLCNEIPDKISRSFDQDIFIISADWHTL